MGFESVPKMLSAKRRQTEESFQMKNVENDEQLVAVHKSVLGMLEHMAAFEKRLISLESRQPRVSGCFPKRSRRAPFVAAHAADCFRSPSRNCIRRGLARELRWCIRLA